jgi:hypothetical protein
VRQVRMLGLCLVAVCAIAALASASASAALPEWGKCVKVPVEVKGKVKTKGKYTNANCTEKGAGEYEFLKGTEGTAATEFTASQTSEKAELETSQGIAVTCESTVAHGFITGTKEVSSVQVTFTGCELGVLNFSCEGSFESFQRGKQFGFEYKEGEIFTRGLKGSLGYIAGKGTSEPEVGLALVPEEKGGLFAEFGCGAKDQFGQNPVLIIRVGAKEKNGGGDSIISPISPVNTMGTVLTQTYSEKEVENENGELHREQGHQNPESFEGKKRDVLESEASDAFGTLGWAQAGQVETLNTSLNSGEELEIKA